MNTNKIRTIFDQFSHGSSFLSANELNSGHINDSFLIHTPGRDKFVLQRINHEVFKDIPGLMANKIAVSKHLSSKLPRLSEHERRQKVLSFVPVNDTVSYYKDTEGNYWNLSVFIPDSTTHEVVNSEGIAYEGGKLFGDFLYMTSDLDPARLTEVIPDFHNMASRYQQFDAARNRASEERLGKSGELIARVLAMKSEMHILQNLKADGVIRLRVTHNDTKISNALFDTEGKGLCVIDTDTVMPGIVHYDFGDAIRTICNTAAEDEKNLELVTFNKPYYEAYEKGFLEKVKGSLSEAELKYLPLGAKTMIFIMALRFLTDYLNNDTYYKTTYPEHNLDRAKNQFKLLESFDKHIKLNFT